MSDVNHVDNNRDLAKKIAEERQWNEIKQNFIQGGLLFAAILVISAIGAVVS